MSSDDKQLCVDGLTHGEAYTIILGAGLPSAAAETLAKSADFHIYVRDRAPSVHSTSTACVLPRTGQRGIPIISVNTNEADVEIYRVGDRLIDSLQGNDFKRSLYRYEVQRLADERGATVWKGAVSAEASLNVDVTTAVPIETVNLTALVRDARGDAVAGSPLTLVVDRPDGVEFRRALVPDQGVGGRALSVPLAGSSPRVGGCGHSVTRRATVSARPLS